MPVIIAWRVRAVLQRISIFKVANTPSGTLLSYKNLAMVVRSSLAVRIYQQKPVGRCSTSKTRGHSHLDPQQGASSWKRLRTGPRGCTDRHSSLHRLVLVDKQETASMVITLPCSRVETPD